MKIYEVIRDTSLRESYGLGGYGISLAPIVKSFSSKEKAQNYINESVTALEKLGLGRYFTFNINEKELE